MIFVAFRHGIGFDMEATDDIIHVAGSEEGGNFLVAFNGMLIKLPLLSIYVGTFEEFDQQVLKE